MVTSTNERVAFQNLVLSASTLMFTLFVISHLMSFNNTHFLTFSRTQIFQLIRSLALTIFNFPLSFKLSLLFLELKFFQRMNRKHSKIIKAVPPSETRLGVVLGLWLNSHSLVQPKKWGAITTRLRYWSRMISWNV